MLLAEAVLERGVAAYPYSGALVAELARQYVESGRTWQARNLVRQYRTLFPEDPVVRAAQSQIENSRNGSNSIPPSGNPSQWLPK